MKSLVIICVFSIFIFLSCDSGTTLDVNDIRNGVNLRFGSKSHSGQYLAVFGIKGKGRNENWEILYKDANDIYFGPVNKATFSDKEEIQTYALHKISREDLEKDIPFYDSEDFARQISDSINHYFSKGDRIHHADISSIHLILRGDSINYQIQGVSYWNHFEMGMQSGKYLALTDKWLNVLEVFSID